MADFGTPLLEQVDSTQAAHEVTVNALLAAMSGAAAYGRHAEGCAGLTWAWYGVRFGGTEVANGSQLLTASDTFYMTADLVTGAVDIDTDDTNWLDSTNYGRCYLVTTGTTTVTDYEDHREGPSGIKAAGGSGSSTGDMLLSAVQSVTGAKTFSSAKLLLGGATSGAGTLNAPAIASTYVWTLPAATGTLADLASTQAFTNKTYNGNTLTAGTYTLTGASGKTLTFSNSMTLAGTDGTTMTFPPASASIGYLNIPQNSQSTAYTTVLADAGKHILHPSADTTARTMTIDSNANVAYPIGTALTFINQNAAGVMTIAITSDTMRLAGTGATGSRTLAANGVATAVKVTSTEWIISGSGLT